MKATFEQLQTHVTSRNWHALQTELSHMMEVDIAAFIESLPAELALLVFRALERSGGGIFANFKNDQQELLTVQSPTRSFST